MPSYQNALKHPCPAAKTGWSKQKYRWKEQVTRTLSRGPATLANWLCDTYANRDTAVCWPSNARLAKDLTVDIRTIQRWLRVLEDGHWVSKVRLPRRRRAFQLTFPAQSKGDSEHDKTATRNMTDLSAKHDKTVAPYKEPLKNPVKTAMKMGAEPMPYIRLSIDETLPLKDWQIWVAQHSPAPWPVLEPCIRFKGWLHLPCRFPKDGETARATYRVFFENALKSNGRIFTDAA